jgi:hypothetical protein
LEAIFDINFKKSVIRRKEKRVRLKGGKESILPIRPITISNRFLSIRFESKSTLPRLVSEGASLSQYRGRSLAQASADMLATEELTPTSHSCPVVGSSALADLVPLQSPWSRGEGLPRPDHPHLSILYPQTLPLHLRSGPLLLG